MTDRGNSETGFVSLSGDRKTSSLPQAAAFSEAVSFSPDGRFILQASDASGRDELYVASSASPTQRIRISTGGVLHGIGMWSRDGREIFYISRQRQMISVPIQVTPSLSPGTPSVLFTTSEGEAWDTFDVSPDGKRFLAVAVHSTGVPEPPINVILNWTAEGEALGGSVR